MNLAKVLRKSIFHPLPLRARNGSGSAFKKGFIPPSVNKLSFEDQEIVLDRFAPAVAPVQRLFVEGVKIVRSSAASLQQISGPEPPQEPVAPKYYKPKGLKPIRGLDNLLQAQPEVIQTNPLSSAKIYENLGMISYNEARFEESLSYFQESVKIKSNILGRTSMETVTAMKKVGLAQQAQGESKKAIESFEKVLNIELKAIQKNNKEIGITYTNLAICSRDIGDYNNALMYCAKASELLIADQKSSEMANILNISGTIYYRQNQYENALKNLESSLDTLSLHFKEDHSMIAQVLNNIALVKKELGNLDEAYEYIKRSLRIQQRILHKKHSDIATTYNYLGSLQYAMGDYEYAKISLKRSLSIRKHVFGKGHKFVATAHNDLGLVHCSLGDYEKALKSFKASLEIRLNTLEVHHETATSHYNIAMTYASQEKHQKALQAFKNYFDIETQLLAPDHPDLAEPYNQVGKAYQNLKQLPKALEYYVKEAEIKSKAFGEDSIEVADSYRNIGSVYYEQQDYESSLNYCKKSYDIFARTSGLDSFAGQRLCFFLKSSYKALGYADAEIEEMLKINKEISKSA